jgi:hypothetical protein
MNFAKNRWWLHGLFWGAMMFIFMGVLWPLSQHTDLALKKTVLTLVFWMAAGLFYGWLFKTGSVRWHFKSTRKD